MSPAKADPAFARALGRWLARVAAEAAPPQSKVHDEPEQQAGEPGNERGDRHGTIPQRPATNPSHPAAREHR